MRRKVLHAGAAIAALALTAACAAPAPTTGTADDETAIRGLASKYAEAFNKGDVAGLSALITSDYEVVGPDGTVVKGKQAFEEMERKGVAERAGMPLVLNVQTSYVRWMSGTSAAAGGTWTMQGVPAGMGADKGAWIGTFKKESDGQWRMSGGLVSEYHPPPAMPMPTPTTTPAPGGRGGN
jgi:uncharacterized protein (TIGR02246 family)